MQKNCDNAFVEYSPAIGDIISCLNHSFESNFFQPYNTQNFVVNSEQRNPRYNTYVFDKSQRQRFYSLEPKKICFEFGPGVLAATCLIVYALLITNKPNQIGVMDTDNLTCFEA